MRMININININIKRLAATPVVGSVGIPPKAQSDEIGHSWSGGFAVSLRPKERSQLKEMGPE